MYRSSSSVFMMNKTPSGMKKHRRNIEPERHQMAQMVLHQPIAFSQRWSLMSQFKPITEQLWLH